MAKGKQTCKILKEIRRQIAAENDIKLVIEECTYHGDCLGTCPKCEAEVRYLERELEKRQRLGKAAVFAGMSIGTLLAASACGSTADTAKSNANCSSGTEMTDDTIHRPLAGDVVAIEPQQQEPDTIEEPLMGIFPMYRNIFTFDAEAYRTLLQPKFVFDDMEGLSIVSGEIQYEYASPNGTPCQNLEELAKMAKEFRAPHYLGGEEYFLKDLASELKDLPNLNKYTGTMEVEFTVNLEGNVEEVKVVKGINKTLNAAVVTAFDKMTWDPGEGFLEDHTWGQRMKCRCVKKIQFPIK